MTDNVKKKFILDPKLEAYIRYIKLTASRVWREFVKDRCMLEANAMAYRTLLAVVPLTAVFLTIFTSFGAFNGLRDAVLDFISSYIVPSAKGVVLAQLKEMADKAQALSGLGIVGLIIAALYLFNAIEMAFNRIWNISENRSFIRRFTAFTAILLWSPIFFGLSFYLTGLIQAHVPWLSETPDVGHLTKLLLRTVPVFFTWAALSIIFVVTPNTRVDWRSAAIGAAIAGAGWELVKLTFNYYVVHAVNYSKIYGPLSVIPIFIVGIYLLWLVVFIGAEITYVLHNYRYHDETLEIDILGFKPYLAVGVMTEIGARFHSGLKPARAGDLAKEFRVALPVLKEVLSGLEDADILTRSENDLFVPARDLHLITIEDVIDATIEKSAVVRRISQGAERITSKMTPPAVEKLSKAFGAVEAEHGKAMRDITIDDLMNKPDRGEK